jgi:hypothetical protein
MVWVMRLSHKVLGHKHCNRKSFLFTIGNGIGHSICENWYTSIIMIYLDWVKLETLGWYVGVMHWTDHKSYFSKKKKKKRILPIGMTVTPKTSYDVDS